MIEMGVENPELLLRFFVLKQTKNFLTLF
jgi:hypothetical protein